MRQLKSILDKLTDDDVEDVDIPPRRSQLDYIDQDRPYFRLPEGWYRVDYSCLNMDGWTHSKYIYLKDLYDPDMDCFARYVVTILNDSQYQVVRATRYTKDDDIWDDFLKITTPVPKPDISWSSVPVGNKYTPVFALDADIEVPTRHPDARFIIEPSGRVSIPHLQKTSETELSVLTYRHKPSGAVANVLLYNPDEVPITVVYTPPWILTKKFAYNILLHGRRGVDNIRIDMTTDEYNRKIQERLAKERQKEHAE